MMNHATGLQSIRSVGGIVPPSMFERIRNGTLDTASLTPASYHLASGEHLRDAANRAFSYLRGAYTGWRQAQESQPNGMDDTRAQTTRERWLLVLLRELGYGQVPTAPGGITVEEREYPVSHRWGHVPVHLLGPGVDLDSRTPGVAGAARAPQAMVQELLNRTDEHLWAVLSNGRTLRLLRDSTALAGSAYLEVDLDAMFDGELFSEFFLLWQLAHVSRLEKRGGADASAADCWLEVWRNDSVAAGTRALDQLRAGVEEAIAALGAGFIRHPQNRWLVEALRTDGGLSTADYQRALLRLVYRLLFVFVAEDRDALLDPDAPGAAKERYNRYFGTARLRRLARIRSGGPHSDLWEAQALVLRSLGGDGVSTGRGEPALALPALSGLFDPDRRLPRIADAPQLDLLLGAALSNEDFLAAVRALSWIDGPGGRVQPVDYRSLDSEELGSVYESLLELVPRVDLDQQTFHLERLSGNERKTTGSYYTPPALVNSLLDTALEPVLDRAVKEAVDHDDAARRLLELTVCDPACGSGHFLVAAARRIASRLAEQRAGDEDPTPDDEHHALRDVVGHCIYGVDANDLAAELAKVSLWLVALDPGKPLGFLDAHIKVGNSLLGATPALLTDGVPDAAFSAILTGDDKQAAKAMKATNSRQRRDREHGWMRLDDEDLGAATSRLARPLTTTDDGLADSADETRDLAAAYFAADSSDDVRHARQLADAWCSAFVWRKVEDAPSPPTEDWLRAAASADGPRHDETADEVARLAEQYRFFHWHIEFPDVFGIDGEVGPDGWSGGFSCVLGNPPWERIKLQEQEFFAARHDDIAKAPNAAARKSMIKMLEADDAILWAQFQEAKRRAEGESALVRFSGRYPLTGRGDVNTYAVFAEADRSLIGPDGRLGVILPTGIATDATTQYFFRDLVETASLGSLFDFENAKPVFPGVHRSFKFCLLTLTGRNEHEAAADFAFFLHDTTELDDPGKRFALTPEEITLLNPNTGTCPVFRSRRDAEITLGIYRRIPVLVREGDPAGNPWGVSFMRMFDMSNDSDLFHTGEELEADGWTLHGNIFTKNDARMLPLYESKLIHQYDYRWATYNNDTKCEVALEDKDDPALVTLPRYWVKEVDAADKLSSIMNWQTAWRGIARTTDIRTSIAAIVPPHPGGGNFDIVSGIESVTNACAMVCALNSLPYDYTVRQKLTNMHLQFSIVKQIAIPSPTMFNSPAPWDSNTRVSNWSAARVMELSCVSWEMERLARDLGDSGPPFRWDPERRALIRAELDAAMFHLYGLDRDEVDYVMDTFPIVRRKDEAAHGEYRTKRLILEVYDAMAEAQRTGQPYQSIVDPEPGHGPRHPESSRPEWATPVPMPDDQEQQFMN